MRRSGAATVLTFIGVLLIVLAANIPDQL